MYLKIENPGVCPIEGFTLLGATSKRGATNPNLIGQFGSGNKHAAAVLLRSALPPIVFCSNHKLEFGTKQGTMKALEGDTMYSRMVVKHGGKEEDGTSVTFTEDLSQTDQYGIMDWTDIGMALREFVSNAIDATITYNSLNLVETLYPWDGVKVEVVEDNQVRAKKGYTRVFIPMKLIHGTDEDVIRFVANLGKWFLHFSEPDLIYRVNTKPNPILEKRNRNFEDNNTAVIYRRGVRVREISSWNPASLFDYNLPDLRVDESRNVDDYACSAACAKAMVNADVGSLTKLLSSFVGSTPYWEHTFSQYDMRVYNETEENAKAKEKRWETALENLGANAVLVQDGSASTPTLERKGYNPIKVSEGILRVAETMKVRTPSKVLTDDDLIGRQVVPANEAAVSAVDWAWGKIIRAGMTKGKEKPPVHCFRGIMDGMVVTEGFYREGAVYLNENICSGAGVTLRQVAIEELAHYITGSTDNSRDFQQWALEFGVRSIMVGDNELPPGE